jgi:hypothetical protein
VEISVSPEVMSISAAACPLHANEQAMDLLYVVFAPECARPEWRTDFSDGYTICAERIDLVRPERCKGQRRH